MGRSISHDIRQLQFAASPPPLPICAPIIFLFLFLLMKYIWGGGSSICSPVFSNFDFSQQRQPAVSLPLLSPLEFCQPSIFSPNPPSSYFTEYFIQNKYFIRGVDRLSRPSMVTNCAQYSQHFHCLPLYYSDKVCAQFELFREFSPRVICAQYLQYSDCLSVFCHRRGRRRGVKSICRVFAEKSPAIISIARNFRLHGQFVFVRVSKSSRLTCR